VFDRYTSERIPDTDLGRSSVPCTGTADCPCPICSVLEGSKRKSKKIKDNAEKVALDKAIKEAMNDEDITPDLSLDIQEPL
jgi:hypothetical protein